MVRRGGAPINGEQPLRGVRVAVTRPAGQADDLTQVLRGLGAEVLITPLVRIAPPRDPSALHRAVGEAAAFDAIVFTSANAVAVFLDALEARGTGAAPWVGQRVAAVGPATAAALEARGVPVDAVPPVHIGEAVAEALGAVMPLSGARILWPRAAAARDVLQRRLEAAGARVVAVEAYRTEPDVEGAWALANRIRAGDVDVITFASSSAVRSYVSVAGTDSGGLLIAAIGPVTAQTARASGLPVHLEPHEHTAAGMASALRRHFESEG
jgi:uroporphyrinogen-III synthase